MTLSDLFYDAENPFATDALLNTEFYQSYSDAKNQIIIPYDSISHTALITKLYSHDYQKITASVIRCLKSIQIYSQFSFLLYTYACCVSYM